MKNMIQVERVAVAGEKVLQTSDKVHSIAANLKHPSNLLLKNTSKIDASLKLASELKFANAPLLRMQDPARYIPRYILSEVILLGKRMPDPKGSNAIKITHEIIREKKNYQLHIIYNESEKTIFHFHIKKGYKC